MVSSGIGVVGMIDALWRFPVKSMQGERLQELELTPAGVFGDRAYALDGCSVAKRNLINCWQRRPASWRNRLASLANAVHVLRRS